MDRVTFIRGKQLGRLMLPPYTENLKDIYTKSA